jgi:phosphohistidine phosphatase SixA
MRTATLLAPVIAAEKRLLSAPRRVLPAPSRRLEIDWEHLIRSVEISDDEILDDLLYPADHRAVGAGAWESGRFEPR